MEQYLAIVICSTMVLVAVNGYSSGAPPERCGDMQPDVTRHQADAQNSDAPYTISLATQTYPQSDGIAVSITGDTLRGLLCQVRKSDGSSTDAIGSFTIDSSDVNFQTRDCPGGSASGATHRNGNDKADGTVMFTWMPPTTDMGTLKVICTVVKVKNTYWKSVESSDITYVDDSDDSDDSNDSDGAAPLPGFLTTLFIVVPLWIIYRKIAY